MNETALIVSGLLLLAIGGEKESAKEGPTRLSRKFDHIFRQHCRGIPVGFLRALAKHESDFNSLESEGPAWGLLQVVESVRRDHFARTGEAPTRQDLLDPETNVKVACSLLKRIASSYQRNHPRSLAINWQSRRWVELLVAGWNAGYSEAAGVGFVVRHMEAQGYRPEQITVHSMQLVAQGLPGASRHLKSPARLRWWRRVVDARMAQQKRQT